MDIDLDENRATKTDFADALEQRYLTYALSTITNRALPDVRDGLKPVHRRILYAMRQLKLDPEHGFKKSARVVGDVVGRFHPHGDQAVYDSLVRLAQSFAVRYPLVDGQGNFGNIDGDNAAAMRYTEARLTPTAQLLLGGIDNDTVDFRATYDDGDEEPIVLPAAFPNLLANGATGIAVGMATSIPPHNVYELCGAALNLLNYPHAGIETLLEHVKGPDFPTGGICVEPSAAIRKAYACGRGSFRLRARYTIESLPRGQWQIIITEIPYMVQKARLIERIAELMQARTLTVLEDIRDESAEDMRLILIPKVKTIDPLQLMAHMFRQTDLETRIPLNMNVLDAQNVPRLMGLSEILRAWLEHRKEVLLRRTRFRLNKIARRLDVLDGYLIAYLHLDEVIAIIREEDEPRARLMTQFKLNEVQAEAILNMRLRALRRLEETNIRAEHEALSREQANLEALLASEDEQRRIIADEIKTTRKAYGLKTPLGKRYTDFATIEAEAAFTPDSVLIKEPLSVICSQKGWMRTMKSHIETGAGLNYKDGDSGDFVLHAQTSDRLICFASNGRAYTLEAARLPGGRGAGEPIRLMIDIDVDDSILEIFPYDASQSLLVASRNGYGFIAPPEAFLSTRRAGKQILNLAAQDKAAICVPAKGDMIGVLGENEKFLCFERAELPTMQRGRGVRLQRYHKGGMADARVYMAAEGLTLTNREGRNYNINDIEAWCAKRAQAGRIRPKGFPSGGGMGAAFPNRL